MLYRLQSNQMVYAPGLVEYARRIHREGNTPLARHLVNAWPGLPESVVDALLDGTLEVSVDEEEALIITAPEPAVVEKWA